MVMTEQQLDVLIEKNAKEYCDGNGYEFTNEYEAGANLLKPALLKALEQRNLLITRLYEILRKDGAQVELGAEERAIVEWNKAIKTMLGTK
jgi:hypothetical protein